MGDFFFNNEIKVVTVGTDPVDGYTRFCESAHVNNFPFICLGFGEKWGGNDMIKGPGGGHKVVLLKEYLNQFDDDDERLIVFSDCYDAVISASPEEVREKYREIKNRTDCDILFSSESLIWPDSSLDSRFPALDSPYRYLNSGGFLGSIKSLKILTEKPINSSDDDQLYYQLEYLDSVENNHKLSIKLDYNAEIFQTLSSHFHYINIDFKESRVINDLTHSRPLIIHGNGGVNSKMFLNSLCNYINGKYTVKNGYMDYHTDRRKLENKNDEPKIYVMLTIDSIKNISNLNNLLEQKYPCTKVSFNVLNLTDENIDNHIESLKTKYNLDISVRKCKTDAYSIKDYYIELIDTVLPDYDYWFIGDISHKITDLDMFQTLVSSNFQIVSPMLVGTNNNFYSNFWGDVESDGFYKRSFDYFKIQQREYKGYWNVPFISSSIMVSSSKYEEIKKSMNKESIKNNEVSNFDMYFSRSIRTRYNFMYIVNYQDYGVIFD